MADDNESTCARKMYSNKPVEDIPLIMAPTENG